MIAGGTGLAPLRAQVRDMAHRGINPRVHLFVGGAYPCDLYDIETLWHLSLSNPWLTIVPVTEEDENPWWHPYPVLEPPHGLHQRLRGPIGAVVSRFGSWADRRSRSAVRRRWSRPPRTRCSGRALRSRPSRTTAALKRPTQREHPWNPRPTGLVDSKHTVAQIHSTRAR